MLWRYRCYGCTIVGPVVLTPMKPPFWVKRATWHQPPYAVLLNIPEGRYATGVVGLYGCTFEDCTFDRVSFMGTPAVLSSIETIRQE